MHLPTALQPFASLPPVAVCANFEFIWDHSAVDADGDELVYSFCSPLDGGGTPMVAADTTAPSPIHLHSPLTKRWLTLAAFSGD